MVLILAALLLVLPFVELAVILRASDAIGFGPTLLLLVAVSVLGGWLVKREGLGVVRRIQRQVDAGEIPTSGLVDGALVLLAGALMVTPGFVTDAVGLLLLVPPSRAVARSVVVGRIRRKVAVVAGPLGAGVRTAGWGRGQVVDVDEVVARHNDPAGPAPRQLEAP